MSHYELLAACVLWIIGLHAVTRSGSLLNPIGWLFSRLGRIGMPVTECPLCMSSLHGAAWWIISGQPWYYAPLFCIVVAGAVEIVTSLIWKNQE